LARMNPAHPGRAIRPFQPLGVEHVRVAAAAGGLRAHLDAEVLAGSLDQANEIGLVRDFERVVIAFDPRFDRRPVGLAVDRHAVRRSGFFERSEYVRSLRGEFFLAVAARLAPEDDGVRDDVDGDAAFDDADVRRGLAVDAPQAHSRDPLGRDLDGIDAFFRADARMRLEPVDFDLEAVRGGRAGEQEADRIAVENEPRARAQPRDV